MDLETKSEQNQIIIKTDLEHETQKLPVKLLLSLAAGAVTGVLSIFGLFWGIEKIFGA